MLAATPFAVVFVPIFFVTVLKFFKTKVKLLHAAPTHVPAKSDGPGEKS
jgi:multidrug efflux pump